MVINKHKVIESLHNTFLNFINSSSDEAVVDNAKRILSLRLKKNGINAIESFQSVKEYLTLWFANDDTEKTCCLYLDQEHRLIQCQNIFFGTINECDKHAKEIARIALLSNASGIIFSSNVSSLPDCDTSYAQKIKMVQEALSLIDVRVIDHLFICGSESLSFKEEELL